MTRVAVAGASGFIGSALVPALAAAGHDVVRLVRHQPRQQGEVGWDPQGGTLDPQDLVGVEACICLAGAGIADKRWTTARKHEILQSRLDSTGLLARTAAALDPKPLAFLSGSAVGWYGDTGDVHKAEADPAGTGFLADVVSQWEAAAKPAVDAGIRTVWLRSGIVLDAGGGALPKQLLPFKVGAGGRLGAGHQYVPWIALADEVGAILHCLENPDVSGPVNLVAPEPVTNLELTKVIGKVLGRPTFLPTPMPVVKVLLGAQMVDEMLLAGQRVAPTTLQTTGYVFQHRALEPALRAILGKG